MIRVIYITSVNVIVVVLIGSGVTFWHIYWIECHIPTHQQFGFGFHKSTIVIITVMSIVTDIEN